MFGQLLAAGSLVHDRYRIARLIGRGGMGAVYEAVDTRLNIAVAVKQTMPPPGSSDQAFEREARLLAATRHPALPRVSDYFSDLGGQFLVMEYVGGDDLGSLLLRHGRPFPAETVLPWADTLLDALHYLHTLPRPVIHRDIKPQNIRLDPAGRLMLLDFGLAKGSLPGQTTLNPTSVAGYTQQYAPLEQIQGSGTDARSDLYALAATLYRLLSGAFPADALTRAAALVAGDPDPLKPLAALAPDVPPALSATIMQALAMRPRDRPASAQAMRQAIQGVPAEDTLTGVYAQRPPAAAPAAQPLLAAVPAPAMTQTTTPAATSARRPPSRIALVAGAALAMIILLALLIRPLVTPAAPRSTQSASPSAPAAAAPTASPASPTAAPSPAPTSAPTAAAQDWRELLRLDANWNGCPASYIVPDGVALDPDPQQAHQQIMDFSVSGEIQGWLSAPNQLIDGEASYLLMLALTSISQGQEWIRLEKTIAAGVSSTAAVPDHLNIVTMRGCGGGAEIRFFEPLALDAASPDQRSAAVTDFDYFTLQPGESELYSFQFRCAQPGIYAIELSLPYNHGGSAGAGAVGQEDLVCPRSFTLWDLPATVEHYRWDGATYVKAAP